MKTESIETRTHTDEKTGNVYFYAQWTYKNTVYSFAVSTWKHAENRVSGFSKRKNYAGFGTQHVLTENEFLTKFEKQGAAYILPILKSGLKAATAQGQRATDTAPMPC